MTEQRLQNNGEVKGAEAMSTGIQTKPIDDLLAQVEQALATESSAAELPSAPYSKLPANPKIMVIDDEALTIAVVREYLLYEGYRNLLWTDNPVEALPTVSREQPDVVLLDIHMPQVSGLEILQEIRRDERTARIPVVILTATTDDEVKLEALRLGANDFLHKPVQSGELLARLRNILMAKAYQDHLRHYSDVLEAAVRQRTAELEATRRDVIHCLARATEFRDDDTGHHIIRVGRYARIIGEELGMENRTLDVLEQAAQLHDVGKIGIPDAVLLKPGKLTEEEFELMQRHCNFGKKIIQRVPDDQSRQLRKHVELGARILDVGKSPILLVAMKIALTHHERWDGKGYPLGLAGEHIPIEGRITSVADVFDALSSKRPYKPAFPLEKCFDIMREGRGTQFGPEVLDAFFARQDDIVAVQITYADVE